jgi:hypothetical protein
MNDKLATGASYGTAGSTVILGIALNDWVFLLIALVSTVATYCTNRYYKKRREAREEEARAEQRKIAALDVQLRELELQGMRRRGKPREEGK